ncbi:hypothetical protein AAFJ72_15415 [Brevibacillus gelatini]|uniref:hypothetical protein n=1 Tax=Brevibacillus gelatini TaxID=1655277 RepID=UPI003D815BAB
MQVAISLSLNKYILVGQKFMNESLIRAFFADIICKKDKLQKNQNVKYELQHAVQWAPPSS